MKVKKYYTSETGDFVPEVAARPGDDTLYLYIKDRVNGGKMRVPWKSLLQKADRTIEREIEFVKTGQVDI